jgi:biotin-dependent carboxylase-like uncharacterized protein
MDRQAARIANLVVGNREADACVEITLGGFSAEFVRDTCFALAGAHMGARLNGRPIPGWVCVHAGAGDVLALDFARSGCRSYLAIGGGVDVPLVMGSRSTYLRGGFGGYQGRPLRKGDILQCGQPEGMPLHELPMGLIPPYTDEPVLRVILGPQDDYITQEGIAVFLSESYETTTRMDRMGCTLSGPEIIHGRGADIISDGTVAGAVQVPGSKQPIILMADAQTTGGYVKIATIASFDLPLVAQLQPGCRVRFNSFSLLEARELYLKQEYMFRNLRRPVSHARP